MDRHSAHFIRVVDPAREPDVEVRGYFQRLLQWRGGVAYPAVMLLLDRQERGELSSPDLLPALSYIESFLVRRAICQVPTNNLNRIFQALPSQLPAGRSVVDGLHWVLSGSRRFWPSDEELRKAIRWNPFYWQGRPEQQRMVLQRLEESYGHPEPVNFAAAALTVEHVLPQNPGGEWLKVLAEDAGEDESAQELHERVVHTLDNLTLTTENAKLSNHPFQRKQDLLSGSHLEMNRRIAEATRWGMSEILARADDLTDRATALWPAPVEGSHKVERGRDWALLHQALLVMPAGTWTTYGDLATLVGSHPRPIGAHLANTPGVVNAYRVLGHGGRVSDTFRWAGEDRGDVLTVLRADGVTFNEQGAADPAQRLTARDLADLLGMAEPGSTTTGVGADALAERQQRFLDQLHEHNSDAVVKLLKHWTTLGGVLQFGDGTTVTSCFLVLERPNQSDIWPLTIYPTYGRSGYLEVVFKYLPPVILSMTLPFVTSCVLVLTSFPVSTFRRASSSYGQVSR